MIQILLAVLGAGLGFMFGIRHNFYVWTATIISILLFILSIYLYRVRRRSLGFLEMMRIVDESKIGKYGMIFTGTFLCFLWIRKLFNAYYHIIPAF